MLACRRSQVDGSAAPTNAEDENAAGFAAGNSDVTVASTASPHSPSELVMEVDRIDIERPFCFGNALTNADKHTCCVVVGANYCVVG